MEASDIANNAFKDQKTPQEVAKELVIYALRNDTMDNVSVSILKFDWPEPAEGTLVRSE